MHSPGFRLDVKRTWMLVASGSSAKVFVLTKAGEEAKFLFELENPSGRKKNRDLDTDRPGRLFNSSAGYMPHGLASVSDTHEHYLDLFAKAIADHLASSQSKNEYEQLFVAAEPHFLGKLSQTLATHSNIEVLAKMSKDLTKVPTQELPSFIKSFKEELQKVG